MKPGSRIGEGTQTGNLGSGDANKHTFLRFENAEHDLPEPHWAYVDAISHWCWIDTGETGSLEVIGLTRGSGDRMSVDRGTLIVSEDSYFGNGDRGCFYVQEDATAVLLDGAHVGNPRALVSSDRATYGIAGTLMFGTPDHPLTRDLHFGGAFFDKDEVNLHAVPSQRTSGASFVLGPTGRMVVHSADPTTARVVFSPRGKDMPVSQYTVPRDYWKYIDRRGKRYYPAKPELWEQPNIPTAVTAVFRGKTEFNGVLFDGFHPSGIAVSDEQRAQWRNVFFGDNNLAQPNELLQNIGEP
jgi:hypothetical protein